MKCFIAMAFDHVDTDALYDNSIVPTLKGMGIEVFRVDRLEHNDDIDNAIISGIEKCDFMVADLTYARPSVYFEAGYAQRKVPVIYTCRTDHFSGANDDKFGNFRVHFDLKMKNIIGWSKADDKQFPVRLKNRIDYVTKPLRRKREEDELQSKRRELFASLSVHQKTALAMGVATKLAKELGYKLAEADSDDAAPKFYVGNRPVGSMAYRRVKNGELSSLYIFADERFALPNVNELWRDSLYEHMNLNAANKVPKGVDARYVVLTPTRLSNAAIARRLPQCRSYPARDEFKDSDPFQLPPKRFFQTGAEIYHRGGNRVGIAPKRGGEETYRFEDGVLIRPAGYNQPQKSLGSAIEVPRTVSFHFIDAFRDLQEIEARLRASLAEPDRSRRPS